MRSIFVQNKIGRSVVTVTTLVLGLWYSPAAYSLSFSGLPFVQYGDGQSYSLPVSQLLSGGCTGNTGPGCIYDIQSTPGQIKDLVVIATGATGTPVTTNFAGMDNAYPTPSGVSGSAFFRTGTTPDPGGAGQFTGDTATTWDSTLAALKNFLSGDSLAFFFNNNQINSGASTNQNLAGWMQITIRDNTNVIIGQFDFTNNNGVYAGVFDGGGGVLNGDVGTYTSTGSPPGGNPSGSPTDYVFSGGVICSNGDPPVPISCSLPHDREIVHNLGADHAAYALVFPELNTLLQGLFGLSDATLANYTMQIDLRLGCDPALFTTPEACLAKSLNNGYEQLFIGGLENLVIPPIPEPTSLLLLGSGLLLLGLLGSKKHRRA